MSNKLPLSNLNLCIIGCVSSGKSTLLNALFCEELTQTKIKRTTMTPCIFIGNNNKVSFEDINNKISDVNKTLINQSEKGNIKKEDYAPLEFTVGNLDINIGNQPVTIYDIPGLNDARTKSIYYDYLAENFINFNVVLFIIDINSGLNTSDELEILTFIIGETIKNNNKKKIYTLVIINKADDMQLLTNGELEITGELKEMFDQVKYTVNNEFSKASIDDQLIGIIPICALDAYLYRMIKSKGSQFNLKPENILKIGINEMGKKFSKKSSENQREEVYEIIANKDFINDMIKLSGFSFLESSLKKFLVEKCSSLVIDNLMQKYNNLESLVSYISDDYIIILLKKYEEILDEIIEYDLIKYNELITEIVYTLNNCIEHRIKIYSDVNTCFNIYNNIINKLNETFLASVFLKDKNPDYFVNHIYSLVLNNMQYKNTITDIISFITKLIDINCYESKIFNVINEIIKNPNTYNTIIFNNDAAFNDNIKLIIPFLDKIYYYTNKNRIIILQFIRFIILNLIESVYDDNYIKIIYFKFKEINEINITSYILKNKSFEFYDYIVDYDEEKLNELEQYYYNF